MHFLCIRSPLGIIDVSCDASVYILIFGHLFNPLLSWTAVISSLLPFIYTLVKELVKRQSLLGLTKKFFGLFMHTMDL